MAINKWHPTTAIVGFYNDRSPFTDAYVNSHLASAHGFQGVKRIYTLTRAALVKVSAILLDQFIAEVSLYDVVEYCEKNSLLSKSSFSESIPTALRSSTWHNTALRTIHKISDDHVCGRGVRVALIDTGLSPHPILPRLSFSEVSRLERIESLSRSAQQRIAALAQTEVGSYTTEDLSGQYIAGLRSGLDDISEEILREWKHELQTWVLKVQSVGTISGGAALGRIGQFTRPELRHLDEVFLGSLRRVSLDSYNFVQDSIDIEDTDGHGTQMAGILGGRSASQLVLDPAERARRLKYEPDVNGLIPEAEFMVLKCYDAKDLEDANIDAVIRALEHVFKVGATIVYIGLVIDPERLACSSRGQTVKRTISLSRTASAVAAKSIVVCPAGNCGQPGLHIPADAPGVMAITSVTGSNQTFDLTPESNWADGAEMVSFACYGGTEQRPVHTSTKEFGFAGVWGTSVAAAVAAGIFGRALSWHYADNLQRAYDHVLSRGQYTGAVPLPRRLDSLFSCPLPAVTRGAAASSLHPLGDPKRFGEGLLREFRM